MDNDNFLRMTTKDLERRDIVQRLLRGGLTIATAALQLRLSTRHLKRLKAKARKSGLPALLHGNRGKPSPNRLPDSERVKIAALVSEKYLDFTPTFAAEKLSEVHHITHDPKTIQAILINSGVWTKPVKRKKEQHRSWRERRPAYGDLVQFDGSYEHWFEDRDGTGEACLLAAIDDSTGRIVQATFDYDEGLSPVCGFWESYLTKNGKPLAIYLDKFSTYRMNHPLAKENADTLTQFGRAMQELRIEVIHANSPQAKGRVERLFQTLQDRLIKELRLNNISNIESANEFLIKKFIPAFNAKFAVEPKTAADHHRTLIQRESNNLSAILCRQEERTVRCDFTISYNTGWYQLIATQPVNVCKKDIVIVEERRSGPIQIRLRGKYLNYHALPNRPPKVLKKQPWVLPANERPIAKPPANHPWRLQMKAAALQAKLTHTRTF
ncbi:MAG: ISNCY family transposase [Patescibacteria group bacterium]